MQSKDGQVLDTHSISAGLDYPGVGPEHSYLKDSGRAKYIAVNDKEALHAFHIVTTLEGIMPALETAHAFASLDYLAGAFDKDANIVINVSGRGDKDINTVATMDGISLD
jgi:tryptophan synthase beta chain